MRKFLSILVISMVTVALFGAETKLKDPNEVIDSAIQAAGGMQKFNALGTLKLEITETWTPPDGKEKSRKTTAYVDTSLQNSRLELPKEIVIVRNGKKGWATFAGKPDTRPNTPRVAPGTCRQTLLPILLPFSLKMDGVKFTPPLPGTFQGLKSHRTIMKTEEFFFQAPEIPRAWEIFLPEDTSKAVTARYRPAEEFLQAFPEGKQYQVIDRVSVGGVLLPSKIEVLGVDTSGTTTRIFEKISVKYTVLKAPDPALFLSPELRAKIENGDIVE